MKNTLLTHDRIISIKDRCKEVKSLSGILAEIGVYKGGITKLLADSFPQDKVYGFDTFAGVPYQEKGLDGHRVGDFTCPLDEVKDFLKDNNNVVLVEGIFPTTSGHAVENEKFKLVHLDVDSYQSTKECLEFFLPRMVSGGVIISDDYNNPTTKGVNKAVDEFVSQHNLTLHIPCPYQCYIIKE